MKTRSSTRNSTRNLARSLGLVAGLVTLAGMTPAQAQGRDGSRAFDRMDSDSDGVVTQAEMTAVREQVFERLDGDGDGVISAEERDSIKARIARMRERAQSQGQDLIVQADANGDGDLSYDEFMSAPRPMMEGADADQDGQLTQEEFTAFAASVRAQAR